MPRHSKPGSAAAPAIRSSMPECASFGIPAWMHNRVRMVMASFLIKHLLIDWRRARNGSGTRWSMPTPATTPRVGNGSRARAPMPRPISGFSIPMLQGEKFDPGGDLCATLGAGNREAAGQIHSQALACAAMSLRNQPSRSARLSGADRRSRHGAQTRARSLSTALRLISSRSHLALFTINTAAAHSTMPTIAMRIQPLVEQQIGHHRGHRRHQIEQARDPVAAERRISQYISPTEPTDSTTTSQISDKNEFAGSSRPRASRTASAHGKQHEHRDVLNEFAAAPVDAGRNSASDRACRA